MLGIVGVVKAVLLSELRSMLLPVRVQFSRAIQIENMLPRLCAERAAFEETRACSKEQNSQKKKEHDRPNRRKYAQTAKKMPKCRRDPLLTTAKENKAKPAASLVERIEDERKGDAACEVGELLHECGSFSPQMPKTIRRRVRRDGEGREGGRTEDIGWVCLAKAPQALAFTHASFQDIWGKKDPWLCSSAPMALGSPAKKKMTVPLFIAVSIVSILSDAAGPHWACGSRVDNKTTGPVVQGWITRPLGLWFKGG